MATVDAIKKLHTSMIDTRQAYEKASEDAEDVSLKALFADMVTMRQKDHDELHRVLSEMGEKADESGSFMASVHKTVIAARSAIKGIDRDALASFASGEDNIVKQYDDALEEDDLYPATAELLRRQKSALLAKIGEMRALGT